MSIMKGIRFLMLISAVLISVGCESKTFDLSLISLGDSAKDTAIQNKDIFMQDEMLELGAIQYYADENKGLVYQGIPLDNTMGTRITVYKGKIAAFNTNAMDKYSLEFLEKLLKKHGEPTSTLTDRTGTDPVLRKIFERMKEISPNHISWDADNKSSFYYPAAFLWVEGGNYSILSISVEEDGRVRNRYSSFTKEAYKNNIVWGMKYPPSQNSPWYNYMK